MDACKYVQLKSRPLCRYLQISAYLKVRRAREQRRWESGTRRNQDAARAADDASVEAVLAECSPALRNLAVAARLTGVRQGQRHHRRHHQHQSGRRIGPHGGPLRGAFPLRSWRFVSLVAQVCPELRRCCLSGKMTLRGSKGRPVRRPFSRQTVMSMSPAGYGGRIATI